MRVEAVFESTLGRSVPAGLDELHRVLRALHLAIVTPLQDPADHPLVLVLARGVGLASAHRPGALGGRPPPSDGAGLDARILPAVDAVGLLIWPTPGSTTPVPVVGCAGGQLVLLAESPVSFVREYAARLERAGRLDGDLADGIRPIYAEGEVGSGDLEAWIALRAGGAPRAWQALAARHAARGDQTARLIALERCSDLHPGWGEPLVRRMEAMAELGRMEEAREFARCAAALPMWTLADRADVAAVCNRTNVDLQAGVFREKAQDANRPVLDRAAFLLDAVTLRGGRWGEVRAELAGLYRAGGLDTLGAMIEACR
jgi:hypothetical protein